MQIQEAWHRVWDSATLTGVQVAPVLLTCGSHTPHWAAFVRTLLHCLWTLNVATEKLNASFIFPLLKIICFSAWTSKEFFCPWDSSHHVGFEHSLSLSWKKKKSVFFLIWKCSLFLHLWEIHPELYFCAHLYLLMGPNFVERNLWLNYLGLCSGSCRFIYCFIFCIIFYMHLLRLSKTSLYQ